MKIAVTYENGEVFQHFGHSEQFKIYEVQDGKIAGAEVVDTNGSGHGALAGFLKDMQVEGFEQRMAPVMEGNLNFDGILKALEGSCCRYLLVEQDDCYGASPFDCLKASYDHLAAAGYR